MILNFKKRKTKSGVLCVLLMLLLSLLSFLHLFPTVEAGPSWVREIVDSSGDVGWYNSLSLDSSNIPHISYLDLTNDSLKHAYHNGVSWITETVDSLPGSGRYSSLAIDSLDRPHIAYRLDGILKYAYWNGLAWDIQPVDSVSYASTLSLALDSSNHPHIAFRYYPSGDLQYAYWDGLSWTVDTVDWYGDVGMYPSISLDSSGYPHISYLNSTTGYELKYASWDGLSWKTETVDSSPYLTGFWDATSLAVDAGDRPHIFYRDNPGDHGRLRHTYFDGLTWTNETVFDQEFSGGFGFDMVLDSLDRPRVALNNISTGTLMYGRWDGFSWLFEIVAPAPTSIFMSIALDSADNPKFSYYTWRGLDLCYVYWGVDNSPPSSLVNQPTPYFRNQPTLITATASDPESGVVSVTMWHRYSTDNASWTSWAVFGVDDEYGWGWLYDFPYGEGFYQFFSQAVDLAGNVESPHASPDASAAYDVTPPNSNLSSLSKYWQGFSVNMTADAFDSFSGLKNVSLYYNYSFDNSSWSSTYFFSEDTSAPWEWNFTFPRGDGFYRLYTLATDRAGNQELPPIAADIEVGRDTMPPMSMVFPIDSYWMSPPLELTVNAMDQTSGLLNVSLLYRYSPNNSTWGSWVSLGSQDHSPANWNFTFPDGEGYYEACSQAVDNVGNIEAMCTFPDVQMGYRVQRPAPPTNVTASLIGPGFGDVNISWNLSVDDANIDHYEIYFSTTFRSDLGGYNLLGNTASGVKHFVHEGAGEGNSSNFFYYVVAIDDKNVSSNVSNQAAKFTRPLAQGPNLVSIPLIQSNESIEHVLQTVEYDKAWLYDSSSREWKWHMTSKDYRRGLWSMNHTMGLWVNVTGDSNLTVAGIVPAQTTIHLFEGWNLVSFPSFNTTYSVADLKSEIRATRVEGYDLAPPYYLRVLGDAEVLQAGYGYWVRAVADTDWIVEAS